MGIAFMNEIRVRCELPFLFMLVCATCSACTFKVLDSVTDLPIPGVHVSASSHQTLPIGVGHPAEITLGEWSLTTDQDGEFTIWSLWASGAHKSLSKDGYVNIKTVQEFRRENGLSDISWRIHYLTKQSDEVVERVKYVVEKNNDDLRRHAEFIKAYPKYADQPSSALVSVAESYGELSLKARTGRDRLALQDLCPFAPEIQRQLNLGWRDLSASIGPRNAAESLVHNCESRR